MDTSPQSLLRQRPGDQPLPKSSGLSEPVFEKALTFVRRGLEDRTILGKRRYGQELQTFNGRSSQRDADEELLDFLQYFVQHRTECAELRRWLVELARYRLGYEGGTPLHSQEIAETVLQLHHERVL